MTAFLFGIIGGVASWFVTTFVASPLVALLGARAQAAQLLALYEVKTAQQRQADNDLLPASSAGGADVRESFEAAGRDPRPQKVEWIHERERAYFAMSASLAGVAQSQALMTRALKRRFGIDPTKASVLFARLAVLSFGQQACKEVEAAIRSALRLSR